jgi:hypothetical protein
VRIETVHALRSYIKIKPLEEVRDVMEGTQGELGATGVKKSEGKEWETGGPKTGDQEKSRVCFREGGRRLEEG